MTHIKPPHDLSELGKKYDTLKKQFNELRIICDQALSEKSKAKRQRDELKILSDNAIAHRFIAEAQRDKLLSDLNSALDTIKRELGEDRADIRHYRETIKSINKQNCRDTFKLINKSND